MDKGIVITPELKARVQEFELPLHKSMEPVLGGYMEKVSPRGLPEPYCFLVNEEGLLRNLPLNYVGSWWYGTHKHGCPIVGNIIVMKLGWRDGERDIIGLEDEDIEKIRELLIGVPYPVEWEETA